MSDENLFKKSIQDLAEAGLVAAEETNEYFCRRLRNVYPVYELSYKENVQKVLGYLDTIRNFYSIGRQGGFSYVGQVDCLDIGSVTADHIQNDPDRLRWKEARRHFENYVVID